MIQEIDYSKPLPKIDNLLIEFMTFLADTKLKTDAEIEKRKKLKNTNIFKKSNNTSDPTIPCIETLLNIPIEDYRKNAICLILAPYFVNILNLSEEESFSRINQWAIKCNDIRTLDPSTRDFDIRSLA